MAGNYFRLEDERPALTKGAGFFMKRCSFLGVFLITFLISQGQELAYKKSALTAYYGNYGFFGVNLLEAGIHSGVTYKDQFTLGGFAGHDFSGVNDNYGAYFRGIFNPKDVYWVVGLSMRMGVQNGKFAAWYPALESNFRLHKHIQLQTALTAYNSWPAGEVRIIIGNFKNEKGE